MSTNEKKWFIPLESDPSLFTELIHTLGVSKDLAFHDLLTLSPSETELLSPIPRPALALILVIPAPAGYAMRLAEEETGRGIPRHDKTGEDEDVMFFYQTIGNACGLYAALHALANGQARGFIEPSSHIARLIEHCTPLNSAQRIAALESDAQLAAAHASVALRGSTAPPEDITEEPHFAYMAFVKSQGKGKEDGRLYQLEGCRQGPVDLNCVLDGDEDMLSEKALDAVRKFVQEEGKGIEVGYSALVLSVTG